MASSCIFKTITVLIVIRMKFCTQMLKTLLNINSSACHSRSVAKYRLPIKNRLKKVHNSPYRNPHEKNFGYSLKH